MQQEASVAEQLAFINFIQRLLLEGDFVATYKFALLHALADICIEGKDVSDDKVQIDLLTEKFIELYWQHSLPFSATDQIPFLLKQSTGSQAKLISDLGWYRANGVRSITELKCDQKVWKKLLASTKRTIKDGPLWRLQTISKKDECLLYPHDKSLPYIVLNSGISYCFRRFYDLVVSLARTHWIEKIRSISSNHPIIGGQGDLSNFLFGTQRGSLAQAKPVLFHIQDGNCFYCKKPVQKDKAAVDHFIPWARYPNDLGHNFVLAHAKCNNSKSDHLAEIRFLDSWKQQNLHNFSRTINDELGKYFTCEPDRSLAISDWAYQQASSNNAWLWSIEHRA
jgi:hypothetical protein